MTMEKTTETPEVWVRKRLDPLMKEPMDPKLEERLEQSLAQFRRSLPNHPHFCAPARREMIPAWRAWWQPVRLAWTSALGVVCITIFVMVMMGQSQPTWAKVVWQFRSLSFFQATVYVKDHPLAQTEQFDLWMGKGGKVRLRYENQVVFADPRGILAAYDVIYREKRVPLDDAAYIIDLLQSADTFSLEKVIQSLAGEISHLQLEPNYIDDVSGDLKIFILENAEHAEWLRIWTLQESLLPVLLRKWNHATRQSVEVVFSYLDQQSESFFDPQAFEKILHDPTRGPEDLIYSHFKDPSGLPVLPPKNP